MKRFVNNRVLWVFACCSIFFGSNCCKPSGKQAIDRKALVTRHNIELNNFDTLAALTVGNGKFAFTVDATGLQSFPGSYKNGIPLGTFSEWGWHSFPNTGNFRFEETLKEVVFHGRKITYDVQWDQPERKKQAADYFRQNPHRIHLGRIGLKMFHSDCSPVKQEEITNISQHLNLWEGTIYSRFTVDGDTVKVTTLCHPDKDLIAVKIISPLLSNNRLQVELAFPYPSGGHVDDACDWNSPEKHTSEMLLTDNGAQIVRNLDSTRYFVSLRWSGMAGIDHPAPHTFLLKPENGTKELEFSCQFSPEKIKTEIPGFSGSYTRNTKSWDKFWKSGGAVDFSGCTDPRAKELERRVVLSQYLTRIQCTGKYPPQETGLTFNSWYGKFHLEMHWWHAVHFSLWNRTALMEKSLGWYDQIYSSAKKTAQRQGFEGARWPKMVGPDGTDSPSGTGSFLIWQQPHIIYLAELCYRDHPNSLTLKKYSSLVFETAEFMASYAWHNDTARSYQLGPWLIPAQERLPAQTTVNPPFELAYWYWGLQTAQHWRERMGLNREESWDHILQYLPPPAFKDSLYLAAGSAPDTWTNPRFMGDHPAVLGALGFLPASPLVDEKIMKSTCNYILNHWDWPSTWGWDYPMIAMTATRLGMPGKAVDALLMPVQKNSYLKNGHNYQDQRLRIYLPGNGGLLTAIAMMCAGYDGCKTESPGFPKDGTWNVRWEGLSRMP